MNNNEEFGLLFATPSFLEGVAHSIDMGDTLTEYNYSENGDAADARAIASDWRAVGNDLRSAIRDCRKSLNIPTSNVNG